MGSIESQPVAMMLQKCQKITYFSRSYTNSNAIENKEEMFILSQGRRIISGMDDYKNNDLKNTEEVSRILKVPVFIFKGKYTNMY